MPSVSSGASKYLFGNFEINSENGKYHERESHLSTVLLYSGA